MHCTTAQMRANALSWSPTMPTAILLASEDHNLYTFDIRNLKAPKSIFKGRRGCYELRLESHGRRVRLGVVGSDGSDMGRHATDESGRLSRQAHAEVRRHSRRIRILSLSLLDWGRFADFPPVCSRVFASTFTNDAKFVLTGSDDGNVRIWKARASERLGYVHKREEAVRLYRDQLRERWKQDPDVGRITRCTQWRLSV